MTTAAAVQRYCWRVLRFPDEILAGIPAEVRYDAASLACTTTPGCFGTGQWVVAATRDAKHRRYACNHCAQRFPQIAGDEVVIVESRKPTYRDMTIDERTMATALGTVAMVPGIPSKALARDLARFAASARAIITERQAAALRSLVVRYRRQLPRDVVLLAGELAKLVVPAEAQ